MSLWNDLFLDNPVVRETHRAFAKNLKPLSWPTNTLIAVLIVAAVYVSLIGLSLNAVQSMDASLFFYVSLTVSILVSAIVLYGTIAGEREKRTLDLLLVAPVTSAQIVAAKLVRVVLPVLGIVIGVTVPALVFGLVRAYQHLPPIMNGGAFGVSLVGSVLLSLAVSVFVAGVAMYMSSLNRTTASALASTLAVLFIVYVVYSVLAQSLALVNQNFSKALMTVHPYTALRDLIWEAPKGEPKAYWSMPLSAILHGLTGVWLIALATRRLESDRLKEKKSYA